jgi:hypothetical protein
MQIETDGYHVTGVPGLETIHITRGSSGPQAVLNDGHNTPVSYDLAGLDGLIKGLNKTRQLLDGLVHEDEVNSHG